MYDFAQLRLATDAFWRAISTRLQDAGIDSPDGSRQVARLHFGLAGPSSHHRTGLWLSSFQKFYEEAAHRYDTNIFGSRL
jgi:hypothetical protein